MKFSVTTAATLLAGGLLLSGSALAQQGHDEHHPDGATSKTAQAAPMPMQQGMQPSESPTSRATAPGGQMGPGMMGQGGQMGPGTMGPGGQMGPRMVGQGGQMGPGMMGQGGQMGPGMMGQGGQMGPGMMGPGGQMGPGTMGPGGQMGPGMMGPGGQMGPGTMGQGGQMGHGMMGRGGMMRMMGRDCPMMGMMMGESDVADTHAAGRIAFLKAELGITEAQQPAFDAYAAALTKNLEGMQTMRASMMASMQAGTPSERLDAHVKAMEGRLATLKDVKPALDKLYGALTVEQKKKADQILTGMGCMM